MEILNKIARAVGEAANTMMDATHSPLPKPKPVDVQPNVQLSFIAAMQEILAGNAVRRASWPMGEYAVMKDSLIQIFKGGKFFMWNISDGDTGGTDWIIM